MNHIRGLIQLTSPLHVASVDEKGKTMTRPVFGADGRRQSVPIFPANDLRGRLRRKAAKHVVDALVSKINGGIPVELYMGLQCGTASGQPDMSGLTVEEAVRGARDVYMGLFGGGARVLPSLFCASDLVPVIPVTVEAGCVPRYVTDRTSGFGVPLLTVIVGRDKDGTPETAPVSGTYGLCGTVNMTRRDDVLDADNPTQMMASIHDCVSVVGAYQGKVLGNSKARKEEKAAGLEKTDERTKKLDAANMFSAEAVAAGVHLWMDFALGENMTLAQLGLLAQSFSDLVKENRLGGLSAKGFGRFRTQNIRIAHENLTGGEEVPLFAEDGSYTLSPQMAPALEAMRQELALLDVATTASFFLNRKVA